MNQTPAVIVNIQRQPGANTISVVNSIKQLLPQLRGQPARRASTVTTLTDLTTAIKASVADVEFELMLTIALVVLVIFLFLRSLCATIIPSVAVPLSLVGTFGAMYALGYSLDNLSLMALTISTGFVVDDAIVMIENISRYIEEGDTAAGGRAQGRRADRLHHRLADGLADRRAHPAAVHGRCRRPPVPRVRGHAGGHHRHLGGRLADADADDVRAHPAPQPEAQQGRFYRASERVFERMIAFYGRTLKVVLRYQTVTLLVASPRWCSPSFLYIVIPKGFFPVQDTGVIQGISQAPASISFAAMAEAQQELAKVILAGSGGREPLVVHRRRRHQHHTQQRPHVDQPQAARPARVSAPRT